MKQLDFRRRAKLFRRETETPGEENIGKFDEYGDKITQAYTGTVFGTQDEALDRRYSYSNSRKTGVFSTARRPNLFGN